MRGDDGCTWRYDVEQAFVIVGRGVVVVGHYVGEFAVGDSAMVETPMGTRNTHVTGIEELYFKDRPCVFGLLLAGLTPEEVPIGSTVHGRHPDE